MVLDFRYFQYDPEYFMRFGLSLIAGVIINFILYVFIFFSARDRKEDTHKPEYLKFFAIVGMISVFIPLFLPAGFYYVNLTDDERLMIGGFFILQGLILSIPLFVGSILLIMYSFFNRNKLGLYLLVAGILWLINYGFSIITLNWGIARMFSYLLHLDPITTDFESLMSVLQAFFTILYYSALGLFIIHGVKNSDYKFIYAGLSFFIGGSIVGFFSTIGFYYFWF
ncbi:MAG: hypothetical protein ACFE9N_15740 [Promethearchaeota archaeon]